MELQCFVDCCIDLQPCDHVFNYKPKPRCHAVAIVQLRHIAFWHSNPLPDRSVSTLCWCSQHYKRCDVPDEVAPLGPAALSSKVSQNTMTDLDVTFTATSAANGDLLLGRSVTLSLYLPPCLFDVIL